MITLYKATKSDRDSALANDKSLVKWFDGGSLLDNTSFILNYCTL